MSAEFKTLTKTNTDATTIRIVMNLVRREASVAASKYSLSVRLLIECPLAVTPDVE
jgi:hypothetical protein